MTTPVPPNGVSFNTVSRFGVFQDLIILFWDETQQPEEDFWAFAHSDNILNSRYYRYYDQATQRYVTTLQIADGIHLAESMIKEWANIPKHGHGYIDMAEPPLCIYLGFQRDWYTRADFFDILKWSDRIPEWLGFPVDVHWLPNDWFDSPGMLPTLTSGENALEWLEEQNKHHKPEKIIYDFKGVHHE